MAMNPADQADSGGDWRMHLRDMRTLGALRGQAPPADAIQRLSDRALRAAVHNPDHSEAARAGAAEALRARGIAVTPWRMRVAGLLRAGDLAQGERLFFGSGRRLRVWSGVAAVFCGALLFALTGWALSSAGVDTDRAMLAAGVLILPALIWAAATALRRRSARVFFAAPALNAATRAPLKRFIRRDVRPFGHVLLHAPGGPIGSAAAYRAAAASMGNKLAMNLAAARPDGVAMRLGGTPAWAPFTYALGAESADVLIVDLSADAGEQIERVQAYAPRSVFVALWGRVEEAEAALRAAGLAQPCFYYAPDGEMQRRGAFRAAILDAMRATHGAP
ncbi:MAG: hypothetical protein KF700_06475 [Hyphomonadaceae bacterium]|nr:hypothetical protein [Hyphomonadaceae bacterium]